MTSELSPFIAGTNIQYAWDSTSSGWLLDCARKYQLMMIEGWDTKEHALDLYFGIMYGRALEYYDRLRTDGMNYEDSVIFVVRMLLTETYGYKGWIEGNNNKTRETLIRSVIWYLEEFKDDPFETYILQESGKPAVELSFKLQLDYAPTGYSDQPYMLTGHLDRVVNFSGGLYVTDRKTTKSTISSDYFSRFDLDNQMDIYTFAANIVFKAPVKGVVIDGAQIAVGFTRFARGLTYRTPAQTEEFFRDFKIYLRQAEGYAKDNYWPMNKKSCFLCPFKRVCSKDPAVRNAMLESDFVRRTWNPLQVR